jgi:Tol biopolymer transport system component
VRMKRKGRLLLVLGIVFLVLAGGIAWSQVTERVSVDTNGKDADSGSSNPSTSSNGRYVAFQSDATDLVAPASNGSMHIFVRDRQTGTTTQVSVDSLGGEGDGRSFNPSISADGRYVAFDSNAGNLVAGDEAFPFGFSDIFVHDLQMGETTWVSEDSSVGEGDGPSFNPSISADGKYVAFQSEATGLVVPSGSNGQTHIFVLDRQTGTTTQVSVDSLGSEGTGPSFNPSISADGRYVAFDSQTDNLIVGDTNPFPGYDIFVHDRQTGITTLVSKDSNGIQGSGDSTLPSISSDGRYVAFVSDAANLVAGDTNGLFDIFVHDRDADGDEIYDDEDGIYDPGEVSTVRVSVRSDGTEADQASNAPSISSDGRYVAFESDAANLVAGDTNGSTDVFIHDLQKGTTTRVSVDLDGVQRNDNSNFPSMSADGSSVTFQSDADLVADDNNGVPDIFVDDLQAAAGGGGGGGSSSGGGGCFIATAAFGSGMAREK